MISGSILQQFRSTRKWISVKSFEQHLKAAILSLRNRHAYRVYLWLTFFNGQRCVYTAILSLLCTQMKTYTEYAAKSG